MPKEATTNASWLRQHEELGWLALMLLPGLLTVFLAFRSGGFYPGATSLAAAEMALVLALRFALAKRPLQGVSKALIAATAAIGLFAAWTLISAEWSESVSRALPAYSRALLCGLLLFFFGTLPFNPRRLRWMVYGIAAAIVAVCVAALIARLLPETIFDPALVDETRLAYPLTYWNALGILSCIGVLFCAHLACSTQDPPLARVLGAAAVPLVSLTLYYTLSRGAIWAAPAALVVYAVLGRPRALLSGAIATIPTTAIALAVASPSSTVTEGYPQAMVSSGEDVAMVLGACVLAAGLLRVCLLPLDGWLLRASLPQPLRRPVFAGATVTALVLVLAAGTAADVPHVVKTKYGEFTDRVETAPESRGEDRLLSARSQGRFELWDVALDSYREDKLRGSGAGTYVTVWNENRPSPNKVLNAHSLYVEVLGELGLPGLALLLIAIALILGAFAYRARGPDRALFAMLLAAGLAWVVHAGVDWDWQMPAVTLWLFALGGAAMARSRRWRRRRPRNQLKMTALQAGGAIVCLLLVLTPARVALSQARYSVAVDELGAGHCGAARSAANEALSALDERPSPYVVIASCEIDRDRFGAAAVAMQRAVQRDPHNWELHYGLAVARAGAGLDPRAAAGRAARLNPRDEVARSAPRRFRGANRDAWQQAAEVAPFLAPELGDP
ncbi:MAG TPA: O-antigen ligase family protein [Solirubrobacterales bacterium]|nr:O-antigen ligase family protein [Solirubrobacterales bacterium]